MRFPLLGGSGKRRAITGDSGESTSDRLHFKAMNFAENNFQKIHEREDLDSMTLSLRVFFSWPRWPH